MKKTLLQLLVLVGICSGVLVSQLTNTFQIPWFIQLGLIYLATLTLSNSLHEMHAVKLEPLTPIYMYCEDGIMRELL